MADQTMDDDAPESGEDIVPRKKWSGKRLTLFVFLPLLLIGGGLGAAYFMGVFGGDAAEAAAEAEPAAPDPMALTYYDLPEMLVNLNTGGNRTSFLKLKVSLELTSQEDIPQLEKVMPRIIDQFQVYLRELRTEDLSGSAGIYRLREELLTRVNVAAKPVEVSDVLFREMLVQ